MKYLKYYYIFNEANFSTEPDLDEDEKEFLNKVKKERPQDYNKYLTYVKNTKTKGLWYAKNKYVKTDPKTIADEEKWQKEMDKYSVIGNKKDKVKSLLPNSDTLTDIFVSKIGKSGSNQPYDKLMKAVLFDSTRLDELDLTFLEWTNKTQSDRVGLRISGPYLDTKNATLSASNDRSFIFDNTTEGILIFLNNILEKDPDISIDKIKSIKPLYVNHHSMEFASMYSVINIYIHATNYAVSTQITLDITIGSITSKYNTRIFKTKQKAGNLKRGVEFTTEITKEDVIKSIEDAFDMVNNNIIEKMDDSIYNMKNFVNHLLSMVSESHDMLVKAKNYPLVFNKIRSLTNDQNIKHAIDMNDMGFSD
jgi:hypothetical protein